MENPEALGFHQETTKDPIEQTETMEDSSDPRIGFVSNLFLFTRENYYKFRLQYKIQIPSRYFNVSDNIIK